MVPKIESQISLMHSIRPVMNEPHLLQVLRCNMIREERYDLDDTGLGRLSAEVAKCREPNVGSIEVEGCALSAHGIAHDQAHHCGLHGVGRNEGDLFTRQTSKIQSLSPAIAWQSKEKQGKRQCR